MDRGASREVGVVFKLTSRLKQKTEGKVKGRKQGERREKEDWEEG